MSLKLPILFNCKFLALKSFAKNCQYILIFPPFGYICPAMPNHILKMFLADPGEVRGCSTNTFVINSFSDPLVKISLRCRHAQTVQNGASSHKTNYIDIFSEILNLKGYWFKRYGYFSEWVDFAYWWSCIGKGLPCSLRSRLVFFCMKPLLAVYNFPLANFLSRIHGFVNSTFRGNLSLCFGAKWRLGGFFQILQTLSLHSHTYCVCIVTRGRIYAEI